MLWATICQLLAHKFARDWGFSFITSSPRYPQSNGLSERFVQTVKKMMGKTLEDGKEPHLAILEYRNTPVSGISYSFAQLLMNRRLKDKLPTTWNLLNSELRKSAGTRLEMRQRKQKYYMIMRQSHWNRLLLVVMSVCYWATRGTML